MKHIESNQKCPYCPHQGNQHFTATDEIGYWSFCMLESCSCWVDDRADETTA